MAWIANRATAATPLIGACALSDVPNYAFTPFGAAVSCPQDDPSTEISATEAEADALTFNPAATVVDAARLHLTDNSGTPSFDLDVWAISVTGGDSAPSDGPPTSPTSPGTQTIAYNWDVIFVNASDGAVLYALKDGTRS